MSSSGISGRATQSHNSRETHYKKGAPFKLGLIVRIKAYRVEVGCGPFDSIAGRGLSACFSVSSPTSRMVHEGMLKYFFVRIVWLLR